MQICTIYTYHVCLFFGLLTVADPDLDLRGGKPVLFHPLPASFSSICDYYYFAQNLHEYISQCAVSNECCYNFNMCGIFEKVTSFSPILNKYLEQEKLMAAVNSRK